MIRINLLPHKRNVVSKKAIDFRNYLVVTGTALALAVVGGLVVGWVLGGKVDDLEVQKRGLTQQLAQLKTQSAEIANFETDRKTFEEKIRIIRQLKTHQSRPVRFLDLVARQLPERAWLTKLEEQNGTVTIVGRAVGNSDVVEMIRKLKAVALLENLQLVESRRIIDKDLSAYEFTLTGRFATEAS